MAQRNRYVKVGLVLDTKINLSGAVVVGQGIDYLLLERAEKAVVSRKKRVDTGRPRTKKANSEQVEDAIA